MNFIWLLINDFLTDSLILIGLVVFVGLLVQRKPVDQIIIGTLKTIMGVIILNTGAGVMAGVIGSYLAPLMTRAFNAQGLVPMTTSVVSLATAEYGTTVAYIIVGAFIVNLILARFTPLKYIFLAGHHFLYVAAAIAVAFAAAGVFGLRAIIIGSLIAGFAYAALPAINNKFMRQITSDQPLAMGHFGATGYWLAGNAGKIFAKDQANSTENLKLPRAFSFAKETVCAATLIIVILLAVCVALTGSKFLETDLNVSKNVVSFILIQGITFGAGLTILLQGVRMMVAEILTAFEGIASKVVPNAVPALDCPVVFPYAPNAVLIGFVSATVAGILTSIIFGFAVGVAVVPPVIEFFFMGGAGGVFGNSQGGVKGAILGGAIQGVLFIILPYCYFVACGSILGPHSFTVVDPDFVWSGLIANGIGRILSGF
jgi:PTS system ascorbate-specific IIC component